MTREASITMRLEPVVKAAIEKAAEAEGRSMSQWVERVLIVALTKQGFLRR